MRRRGPRSEAAKHRRLQHTTGAQDLHGSISFLLANVQGFLSAHAELTARIRLLNVPPDIVCLNETFLNQSIEEPVLEGYRLVSLRDRADCFGGGVLVFARVAMADLVVQRHISEEAERIWITIHTIQGPFNLCVWYRPPNNETATVQSFKQEHAQMKQEALGTMVLGDLNLHNRTWLKHSAAQANAAGKAMHEAAAEYGLCLLHREPTRGPNLLDVALSDCPNTSATVLPELADHCLVQAKLHLKSPVTASFKRQVWMFENADWLKLGEDLEEAATGFTAAAQAIITNNQQETADDLALAFKDAVVSFMHGSIE